MGYQDYITKKKVVTGLGTLLILWGIMTLYPTDFKAMLENEEGPYVWTFQPDKQEANIIFRSEYTSYVRYRIDPDKLTVYNGRSIVAQSDWIVRYWKTYGTDEWVRMYRKPSLITLDVSEHDDYVLIKRVTPYYATKSKSGDGGKIVETWKIDSYGVKVTTNYVVGKDRKNSKQQLIWRIDRLHNLNQSINYMEENVVLFGKDTIVDYRDSSELIESVVNAKVSGLTGRDKLFIHYNPIKGNQTIDPTINIGQYIVEYELISNTDICFSDCSLKFKIKLNKNLQISSLNKFKRKFTKAPRALDLRDSGWRLLKNETYNDTDWVPNITCNYSENTSANGTAINSTVCNDNGHSVTTEKIRGVWKDFSPVGKTIQKDKWYHIELWGKKKIKLGENNIDATPVIAGYEVPFTWWNTSCTIRELVISNATSITTPISVNDTTGVSGSFMWTLNASSGENIYVHSSCADGSLHIANETDEKAWENASEPGVGGNNPTGVYNETIVGRWHLDDGTDANDSSSDNNDGANNGAVPITGKIGNALNFDGTNDYVDLGTGTFSPAVYTLIAWINTSQTTPGIILDLGGRTGIFINDPVGFPGGALGKASIQAYDGVDRLVSVSSSDINDSAWHFVVGTHNGTHMKIYIDGNLENTQAQGTTLYDLSRPQRVGTLYTGADWFNGSIDEVAIINRTLSPTEIQEMYWNGIDNLTALGAEEVGCFPPASGDWTITTSCEMTTNETAPANVRVKSNSILTIDSAVGLDIDFTTYNLTIEDGSGLLIELGGKVF